MADAEKGSLFVGLRNVKDAKDVKLTELEEIFGKFGALNRCDLRGSHAFLCTLHPMFYFCVLWFRKSLQLYASLI